MLQNYKINSVKTGTGTMSVTPRFARFVRATMGGRYFVPQRSFGDFARNRNSSSACLLRPKLLLWRHPLLNLISVITAMIPNFLMDPTHTKIK
jgi:hypothetical protein